MDKLEFIGAEVYAVLKEVPISKYNLIPEKIRHLFEKYKEQAKYIPIDMSKKFEEQQISKKAKDIVFAISLNYWLTEDERISVLKKLKENEQVLNEKYNVEDMFKKVNKQHIEEKAIVSNDKKWYFKILDIIKKFFKIK